MNANLINLREHYEELYNQWMREHAHSEPSTSRDQFLTNLIRAKVAYELAHKATFGKMPTIGFADLV